MTHYTVLFVALVWSLCGMTSEADHGGNLVADDIYIETAENMHRTNNPSLYHENTNGVTSVMNRYIKIGGGNKMRQYDMKAMKARRKRETQDDKCKPFQYTSNSNNIITHPKENGNSNYTKNTTCITLIEAPDSNSVIHLTFIDQFHIEEHEDCAYDYIEIRDGKYGFAKPFDRYCGKIFPPKITSTGPYLWLKFKSDENIEYEGFKIQVDIESSSTSLTAPSVCVIDVPGQKHGTVNSSSEAAKDCWKTTGNSMDILWNITTPKDRRIYLNFTSYHLEKPNECEVNLVQVFGAKPDMDHMLAYYCGSVSNPVNTEEQDGNMLFIRFFTTRTYKDSSKFTAKFVSYRTLKGDETCDASEFDCEDSTCIDKDLKCDHHIDCRLKADEDKDNCPGATDSLIEETHILVILVIFSLILSGMSFVFLFKCIRKLYQDHKIIKEHIKQSCEDRLDQLGETQLTLDPKLLDRRSEPRESLERENHTNEMYKQQRNRRKPSSIDSDFLPDIHLDVDDEWRREAESIPIEDIRIEHKGRSRRGDTSRKEESLRSRSSKEEQRKEIRDASVGAPDTKESGCQTRESLFQADAPPSSDGTGSGTNSRGFSTFGYSGATIARPSPAPNSSQLTIELQRQPTQEAKTQKKIDRRPMSSETTRSAPDVIIVSKPLR